MCEIVVKNKNGCLIKATNLPDRTPAVSFDLKKRAEACFSSESKTPTDEVTVSSEPVFRPQGGGSMGKMGCRTGSKHPLRVGAHVIKT